MSLKRNLLLAPIAPADAAPLPPPNLTFRKQSPNASFPTGGLYATGNIRFNLNSKVMVDLARKAFQDYSKYNAVPGAEDLYLHCLAITSTFEGGFDAVNAYDKAGISLGFLQFARPEAGAGKLLVLAGRPDLEKEIRTRFGVKDPHNTAAATAARQDDQLMRELVKAITTPAGIHAQFALSINQNVEGQLYFDKAYGRMQTLGNKDPMCLAMLFDASINMGCGCLPNFAAAAAGASDGDWLKSSAVCFSRPERRAGWEKLIGKTFA